MFYALWDKAIYFINQLIIKHTNDAAENTPVSL